MLLSQDDYIALTRQFNVPTIFSVMVEYFLGCYLASLKSETENGDEFILKLFSISTHILRILERSCYVLPLNIQMMTCIAQLLVTMNKVLFKSCETLKPVLEKTIIFKILDNIQKTTITAELDKFLVRTVTIILRKHSLGWKHSLILPFDKISRSDKEKLIDDILSAKLFLAADRGTEFLIEYLITVDGEAVYFFPLLFKMVIDINPDYLIDAGLSKKIVRAGFDLCLSNADLKITLLPSFTQVVKDILKIDPQIMSFILSETRVKFDKVSSGILQFIEDIPLHLWKPTLNDIYILEAMLKDPVDSPKVKFVRKIINTLSWEEMVN